jgi:ABC-type nitrate/sulfonate/bicarbonate transport system ATPase subunit
MASRRKLLLLDEALSQVDRITRTRLHTMMGVEERTTISVEHERT